MCLFIPSTFHTRFAAVALFVLTEAAQAAEGYKVTVIADSRSSLAAGWVITHQTSLNDAGNVVFSAFKGQGVTTDSESVVLFGDGGSFTTVAQGFRPKNSVGPSISGAAINNRGQVIYNVLHGNSTGFNGTAIWENGASRVYMDNRQAPSGGAYRGGSQGGLSDNARVQAQQSFGMRIAGEGGGVFAGGGALSDGRIYQYRPDGYGAISRDGRYAANTQDLLIYEDGKGFVSAGFGIVAIGASGTHTYVIGQPSANGPTASPSAVSINNTGYASFISSRPGDGSFIGLIDTRNPGNHFTRLVGLDDGFTRFGDSNRGGAINNWNEIVFLADPSGDGVNGDNVYVTNVGGSRPKPILQRGDMVTADGAVFWDAGLGPNTHSFNDRGQVSLMARLTLDGGQTTFDAIVRVDPLAGSSPGNPVLPTPGGNLPGGGWTLQPGVVAGIPRPVPVPRGRPVFLDPDVAVGYDYAISSDGPNILGVLVPAALANGDEDFLLEFDGHAVALKAGSEYSFTDLVAGGVRSFRLSGIDVDEALDPTNPQAFVTGLVFGEGGSDDFSVTMQPLVVSVPEPASALLLLLGLGALGWRARRPTPLPLASSACSSSCCPRLNTR